MRIRHPSPTSTAVIRGMAVHAQPHALVRPGKSALPVRGLPPAAAAEDVPAAKAPTYEQGLVEGQAHGRREGSAEAVAKLAEADRAVVERARSEAAAQGAAEGFERGREAAQAQSLQLQEALRAQAEQATRERTARLDALIAGAELEVRSTVAKAEDELVAFAHETVCAVLGTTAATPQGIASIVSQLLAAHSRKKSLCVHLHPQDLAALVEERPELHDASACSWVADADVRLGGVLLRSPEGSLDARLETQLLGLQETLVAMRRERAAAASSAPIDREGR